jgi:replicative DNA helicase
MDYSKHWASQKKAYQKALSYVKARQQGTITSFKTPWIKVNDAGVNGLEWQSLTVIGGRPGTGKTLVKDQIIREGFKNNKGQNMRVLEFQFEMVARASKVREFCSVLGKSYKYVCSAYEKDKLSAEDFDKLHEHSKSAVDIKKYPVDIVENPCDVRTFENIIKNYMEQHSQLIGEDSVKVYTNTVITVDHSLLFKLSKTEKNKTDMLYELGETITKLKRLYPIAFIVLSQLGRHVESPERNENGKYGNYILETDLFGGDALMQHADMVIGINRPAMKFIEYYGPDRYIIIDDTVLVFHFLKTRTGDTRMSFFKAEFEKMQIIEMATPGVQQKRINTK